MLEKILNHIKYAVTIEHADPREKMLAHAFTVIWVLGTLAPLIIFFSTPDRTSFIQIVLPSLAIMSFVFFLSYRFKIIKVRPLAITTSLLFNLAILSIIFKAPIYFGSVHFWLFVCLILTAFSLNKNSARN